MTQLMMFMLVVNGTGESIVIIGAIRDRKNSSPTRHQTVAKGWKCHQKRREIASEEIQHRKTLTHVESHGAHIHIDAWSTIMKNMIDGMVPAKMAKLKKKGRHAFSLSSPPKRRSQNLSLRAS